MKREFISIDGLKNVLSPKEMKNVLGGSNGIGRCGWSGADQVPCLVNWSGDSCSDCNSFLASTCPHSARISWCAE